MLCNCLCCKCMLKELILFLVPNESVGRVPFLVLVCGSDTLAFMMPFAMKHGQILAWPRFGSVRLRFAHGRVVENFVQKSSR